MAIIHRHFLKTITLLLPLAWLTFNIIANIQNASPELSKLAKHSFTTVSYLHIATTFLAKFLAITATSLILTNFLNKISNNLLTLSSVLWGIALCSGAFWASTAPGWSATYWNWDSVEMLTALITLITIITTIAPQKIKKTLALTTSYTTILLTLIIKSGILSSPHSYNNPPTAKILPYLIFSSLWIITITILYILTQKTSIKPTPSTTGLILKLTLKTTLPLLAFLTLLASSKPDIHEHWINTEEGLTDIQLKVEDDLLIYKAQITHPKTQNLYFTQKTYPNQNKTTYHTSKPSTTITTSKRTTTIALNYYAPKGLHILQISYPLLIDILLMIIPILLAIALFLKTHPPLSSTNSQE